MSMKTISQKKAFSQGKTFLAISLSYYRIWQTSGKILLGSTRYVINYCESYKIISVTPRRLLKTQVFDKKKTFFLQKRYSGQFFLALSSDKKPQGTNYRSIRGFVTVIVEVIGSFP